jgi:excinuclease ABC subunit C
VEVIAIAKRLEEIYKPGDPYPLYVDKQSYTLQLIQRIRNEAHRFAVSFHRHKRTKEPLHSELEDIKGIGPSTVRKLLQTFKSVKKIKSASEAELAEKVGPHKANLIREYFQQSNRKQQKKEAKD